jgi:hypothetical protein
LQVETDGAVLRGTEAQVALYRTLWPDALSAPDGEAALLTALTRSVYLQQDLVREFVEADSDGERFEAVSELVGVGRVRELQVELDKTRRAWTQATNRLASEAEPRSQRLRALESQLERLSSTSSEGSQLEAAWQAWWQRFAADYGGAPAPAAAATGEAGTALDDALKALAADRRHHGRRVVEAQALLAELVDDHPSSAPTSEAVEAVLDEARVGAQSAEAALESARALEAQLREQAIRAEDQSAQLAALAELALQHLGDRCPVCTQRHDRETTVAHLEALIAGVVARPVTDAEPRPDIESLSRQVTERQLRVQELETEIQTRRGEEQLREATIAQRAERLESLGIAGDVPADAALRELISDVQQRQQRSARLQEDGETLALELARSGEVARRAELDKEHDALAHTVAIEAAGITARRESGDLATKILESLRDAAAELVDAQLKQMAPLVERVYARIDPHPAFRNVQLTSRFEQSRGRVRTTVADTLSDVVVKHPGTVLSSSQVNALAVSIFLALNLGVPARPLDAVLLDDPLQSLDDVNLLGLVDLLRRTKQQRQLIISTHDVRFAGLLERKLRPDEGGKTMVIELSGWRRDGPQVRPRDVVVEPRRLRLVS